MQEESVRRQSRAPLDGADLEQRHIAIRGCRWAGVHMQTAPAGLRIGLRRPAVRIPPPVAGKSLAERSPRTMQSARPWHASPLRAAIGRSGLPKRCLVLRVASSSAALGWVSGLCGWLKTLPGRVLRERLHEACIHIHSYGVSQAALGEDVAVAMGGEQASRISGPCMQLWSGSQTCQYESALYSVCSVISRNNG